MSTRPTRIVIAGFGAVAEFYHAQALGEFLAGGMAEVVAVFDPQPARLKSAAAIFPGARMTSDFSTLPANGADLAIVASPPRFHAEQSIALMENGCAVLCEKPMALTVAEGEAMAGASARTGKPLAVGLFRRFFPVSETIRELIRGGALGCLKQFEISEGGPFGWPAQSASFFQKSASGGGVLADLGVHLVDLLVWWLGEPEGCSYSDDAMGGLEANCMIELRFAGGVTGTVRLSRDTLLPNRMEFEFERGRLRCKPASADELEIGLGGAPFACAGALVRPAREGSRDPAGEPAPTYAQCFTRQLQNMIRAARGEEQVFIPAAEGIRSLRVIGQCYRERTLMQMPWLDAEERGAALKLNSPA